MAVCRGGPFKAHYLRIFLHTTNSLQHADNSRSRSRQLYGPHRLAPDKFLIAKREIFQERETIQLVPKKKKKGGAAVCHVVEQLSLCHGPRHPEDNIISRRSFGYTMRPKFSTAS